MFYVPDDYLSGRDEDTDLRYLTGKENRGGNSISVFMPGLSGMGGMNRVSNLISRNEETLESLEALRKDLEDMLPVMQTIHDALLDGRDRSEKPEGVLADALTAWCALAVAAKEPFYSEEAADTPEADAALEGPLERPADKLDDKPAGKAKTAAKKTVNTAAKPAVKPAPPAGEVLDLAGETVIKPGQFAGNMTLKRIVIPEGVTEIGNRAFYSCLSLESVTLPETLKKIDDFAFMSCRNLKEVKLPEGIEEIGNHAFGATNSLKEVYLPDSLKQVNRSLFGIGGDSPYATAYMSGSLAVRLMDEYNKGNSWPSDAVYARHYVIDGKGYENMTDYLNDVKSGKVKPKTAAAQTVKSNPEAEEKPAEVKSAAKKPEAKKTAAKKTAEKTETEKAKAQTAEKTAKKPVSAAAEKKTVTIEVNGNIISSRQFAYYNEAADIAVPEGVTEIGEFAFTGAQVKTVTLPKSLKKIDNGAFWNCKKLKEINFPEGLETIGRMAFQDCPQLKDIYLPDGIKKIESTAFASPSGGSKTRVIHLSSGLALELAPPKGNNLYWRRFEIDGEYYSSLKEFAEYWTKNQEIEEKFEKKNSQGKTVGVSAKQNSAVASGTGLRSVNATEYSTPYDAMIRFALPAGYTLEWETGEDFKRRCFIRNGLYYDENGKKAYRFQALLDVASPDDIRAGEGPVQALHRFNPDASFATLCSDPRAELMVKATPLNILGRIVKFYAVWLVLDRNPRQYFVVNFVGTWTDKRSEQIANYRHMINMVNAIRINGKALPKMTMTPEELLRKMPPVFEEGKSLAKGSVQLDIQVNGKTVSRSSVYGDDAGNIYSKPVGKKVYTVDMLPPGQDEPEKIVAELNEMEPEKAQQMFDLLVSVSKLNSELSELNNMLEGNETEQELPASKPQAAGSGANPSVQKQRDDILTQISELEKERDAVKGLFGRMKRRKIQREIDGLKDKLRKLN